MTEQAFATTSMFQVFIGAINLGPFTTCDGLSCEVEYEEYWEGGQTAESSRGGVWTGCCRCAGRVRRSPRRAPSRRWRHSNWPTTDSLPRRDTSPSREWSRLVLSLSATGLTRAVLVLFEPPPSVGGHDQPLRD